MNIRQSFHIYKILEEYSKQYIAFDYSPKYILPQNYYLSYRDVEKILKDNSILVKALYNRDENTISEVLNQKPILIDEFEAAQIEDYSLEKDRNLKKTPLPLQARYVLQAWNMLRLNFPLNEKENMISIFNKKGFNNSFFPQISKMCLAFESHEFREIAFRTLSLCIGDEQFYLFYKILAYYFRLNDLSQLKESCLTLALSYNEKKPIDIILIKQVQAALK